MNGYNAASGPVYPSGVESSGQYRDVVFDEVKSQFPQATSMNPVPPEGVAYRTFASAFD